MKKTLVGIVMGSENDWAVMQHAARSLADFGVAYEARALSAHRSPDALIEWVEAAAKQGAKCFIAGAGGAAHLAGVVAARTTLPVLAVPMPSKHLQ
ncbi:MAG: AIR carboxylase family protein, partial [Gammaproteobacteria bacterium]